MNKSLYWTVPTAVLSVLALIVSLNTASRNAPAEAPAQPQRIEVRLTEFKIEPATIHARAGAQLTFVVTNAGSAEHNFAIVGQNATEMIPAGKTAELVIDKLDAGTYNVLCSVSGHAGAGMTARLDVTAGGPDAGAPPVATAAPGHSAMSVEEMDAAYLAGVKAFPAKTNAVGNQPMQPRIENGVKVFELTAAPIQWEIEPGVTKPAMAYNGQIPGPQIRVSLRDRVRVVFHNRLNETSNIHFHGVEVPNDQDGVVGLTEDFTKAGQDRTYEFTVPNSGSHMYHAHMASQRQVNSGLLGAFVVAGQNEPAVSVDHVMVLNDGPLGFTINGKGFPATDPIVAKPGQTIRVRYMNEGLQGHPMHLHGMSQEVIALDGWPVQAPYRIDTVWVAPGQRVDVLVRTRAGLWAYHCHILNHAEDDEGFMGMTTVLVVK